MKLDDKNVTALTLPAGKTVFDGRDNNRDYVPGFCVRGGKRGKTWYYKYRLTGERALDRWYRIGLTTAISAATARAKAREVYARVQLGEDPAADKAETKAKATDVRLVDHLDEYLELKARKLRVRTFAEVKRHLKVNAEPIHGMTFAALEADDEPLRKLFKDVTKRLGESPADHMRSALSGFFGWAISEHRAMKTNPAALLRKHGAKNRTRVLTDDELRIIWQCLPPPGDDFGDTMRLLMLTGQRLREMADLRWSEMPTAEVAELPAPRCKNDRPHRVPLSKEAMAIIARREHWAGRDLVFGTGKSGFGNWSHAKKALDKAIAEKTGKPIPRKVDPEHWTNHDLRRTLATRWAGKPMSVPPHVIEAHLNHISGSKRGVAGIYNLETYEPERADAMARWGERLMAIVGDNVVKLRRA